MWSADWAAALATRLMPRLVRSARIWRSGLVAGRDREGVGEARSDPQPFGPPPPALAGGAQHEADPAVIPVKSGADQHSRAEAQLPEVVADLLEVLVVQLAVQRGEQRPHPVGAEFAGVVVGDLPQLPQPGYVGFQVIDRARQVGRRVLVGAAVTAPHRCRLSSRAPAATAYMSRMTCGVGEAVGQDLLPVADGFRVVQAGEQDLRGHLGQELVAGGHRLQQGGQLQVLDQVLVAGRQAGLEVEVPAGSRR